MTYPTSEMHMIFQRHPPGQSAADPWDFDPGNRLLALNDIRDDSETRALLLDLFGLGGGTIILEVGDILEGAGITVVDNLDGTLTISVNAGTITGLAEAARDALAAALVAGTGITIVTDDPGDTITLSSSITQYTDEMARDAIGTALVQGTGITVTVSDVGDTITVANTITQYTDEMARDAIGAALVAGTGVTITPNDGADTITVATTITQYTDEMARDALGTALVAGSGIAVTVNDGADTITLDQIGRTINDQSGTTYTLVLADATKWVRCNNAAAIVLTVPPNSSVAFPIGTEIEGSQAGAGQITLTPGAGVTLNGTPGLKVAAQHGVFGLKKVAADTWVAYGRLSA